MHVGIPAAVKYASGVCPLAALTKRQLMTVMVIKGYQRVVYHTHAYMHLMIALALMHARMARILRAHFAKGAKHSKKNNKMASNPPNTD